MKETQCKARVILNDDGFFTSTQSSVIHRTNSNTPGKVSSYPAHAPAGTPQFIFSQQNAIHLYSCEAYPLGMVTGGVSL